MKKHGARLYSHVQQLIVRPVKREVRCAMYEQGHFKYETCFSVMDSRKQATAFSMWSFSYLATGCCQNIGILYVLRRKCANTSTVSETSRLEISMHRAVKIKKRFRERYHVKSTWQPNQKKKHCPDSSARYLQIFICDSRSTDIARMYTVFANITNN